MNKANEYFKFKVLILGDSKVGKTSCVIRLCEDTFNEDHLLLTIGLDLKKKFIKRNEKKIELDIFDFASRENHINALKYACKQADGILLIYAVNKKSSIISIKDWLNRIREHTDAKNLAILVMGNKIDLPKE